MRKLAIIGASYLQLPLVKKAKEMGLEVHCFAWAKGALCKDVADYFYPISIVEHDEILKICQNVKIDGICTIASDVAAPTVAYVAGKMGLIANGYEASVRTNNKFLMRNAFKAAGVLCPQYLMVTSVGAAREIDWDYPLIVKPSDRSGSLGVTKVFCKDELYTAVENAIGVSFEKQAMVEEFIEGREISVEFISYKGKHYPLQITDKVTTGSPHFVELEHHQPANFSVDVIFHQGKIADTYNIGSFNEWKNIDIIKVVIKTVDRLLGRKEDEDLDLITLLPIVLVMICVMPSILLSCRRNLDGSQVCSLRKELRRPLSGISTTRNGWIILHQVSTKKYYENSIRIDNL
jgi:hypothetical protein